MNVDHAPLCFISPQLFRSRPAAGRESLLSREGNPLAQGPEFLIRLLHAVGLGALLRVRGKPEDPAMPPVSPEPVHP